jgi:site-specific recombinase XerD
MAGADPFAIMKAMGHADIKTTMIYVSLGKATSGSRWRN